MLRKTFLSGTLNSETCDIVIVHPSAPYNSTGTMKDLQSLASVCRECVEFPD